MDQEHPGACRQSRWKHKAMQPYAGDRAHKRGSRPDAVGTIGCRKVEEWTPHGKRLAHFDFDLKLCPPRVRPDAGKHRMACEGFRVLAQNKREETADEALLESPRNSAPERVAPRPRAPPKLEAGQPKPAQETGAVCAMFARILCVPDRAMRASPASTAKAPRSPVSPSPETRNRPQLHRHPGAATRPNEAIRPRQILPRRRVRGRGGRLQQ